MTLHASNGKIVASAVWESGSINHIRYLYYPKVTLWDGVSNMTDVVLITSIAAFIDKFGV
jgi:hypothetical protein